MMTRRIRATETMLLIWLVGALLLPQCVAAYDMTRDLSKARSILALARPRELSETDAAYEERRREFGAKRSDLDTIAKREYLLSLDAKLGSYDADAKYYSITVKKAGLLDPAYGRVKMPSVVARRAPRYTNKVKGVARIRISKDIRQAMPYVEEVSMEIDDKRWPVSFTSAWVHGFVLPGSQIPGDWVWEVAFHPDGRLLASGTRAGTVQLWDTFAGKQLYVFRHGPVVNSVDFSPDGARLVVAGMFSIIRVVQVATGEQLFTMRHENDHIESVRFSPDGRFIASGTRKGVVGIWDAATGAPVRTIDAHDGWVWSVEFAPTSEFLASAGADRLVKIWRVPSGELVQTIGGHLSGVYDVDFARTRPLLASAGADGRVQFIDTERFLASHVAGVGGVISAVAFAPPEDRAILAAREAQIVVLSPDSGRILQTIPLLWDEHPLQSQSSNFLSVRRSSVSGLAAAGAIDTNTYLFWGIGSELPHDISLDWVRPTSRLIVPDAPTATAGGGAASSTMIGPSQVAASDETESDGRTEADHPSEASVAESLRPPTTALLVGVGSYDFHPDLVNPVLDVETVARELRDMYGVRTTTVLNPTQDEFLTRLYDLARKSYGPHDQLLVFFSGHGYFDELTKRGYLALRDSKPLRSDPLFHSFVSHEEVRTILERLDCNHVLLIVDSCFSGTLDPVLAMAPATRATEDPYQPISTSEYIRRKQQFRTRRYITAGGKEYVSDGRPGHHSPFARQVIAALRSYGGPDGVLTLEEMLGYLERVDPQPRTGELVGNEPGSSFILVAGPADSSDENELRKTFGSLLVLVTPADAEVRVEGAGEARAEDVRTLRVENTGPGQRRYRLPVGTYRVRVTHEGYSEIVRMVTVTEGAKTIRVVLAER